MENQVAEVVQKNKVGKPNQKPLIAYLYQWEKEIPNKVFLRQPKGNSWEEMSWKDAANQVRRMAAALKALNLPEKSNIGIVSKNCSHWILSDLAIMMAGHISVPFYATLSAKNLNQVLVHSGCKVLFGGKIDDWNSMKDGVPQDIYKIAYPDAPAEADGYIKWNDLIAKHEPMQENYVPDLNDLFTIIYTSGTTGTPKGVMHTHFTITASLQTATKILEVGQNSDKFFSYLPLCHIAERAVVETAGLFSGGSISFVESLDTFKRNLEDVQPTHFLAVPRIWTKFHLGILEKMPQKKLNLFLRIPILSGIVKKKIKKSLGLSQAKAVLTGAAPMPPTLLTWFHKLGIPIQEAYGMTENCGCCSLMRKDNVKIGTVGQLYPDCEVKIDAETQEVLMKADWNMIGYYKDDELTAKTIKDGWLHTGDMGEIDSQKFLKITGRVKDQFKTAKGEFVSPAPIEGEFAENNFIEQICLVGRGLAQPIALVVLSEVGTKTDKETVKSSFIETLKKVNANAASHEKVHRVVVCKQAWSIENSILTPTLKIKRNVLEEIYESKLEAWFEQKEVVVWE